MNISSIALDFISDSATVVERGQSTFFPWTGHFHVYVRSQAVWCFCQFLVEIRTGKGSVLYLTPGQVSTAQIYLSCKAQACQRIMRCIIASRENFVLADSRSKINKRFSQAPYLTPVYKLKKRYETFNFSKIPFIVKKKEKKITNFLLSFILFFLLSFIIHLIFFSHILISRTYKLILL